MCLPSFTSIWDSLFSIPLTEPDMLSATTTWGGENGYKVEIGTRAKKRRRYSPSPFAGYGGRRTR